MGSPGRSTPKPPSRREFFRRSGGAALAASALPFLPTNAIAGSVFQHGVASGDPLADRVILWTRVTPTIGATLATAEYVVAEDPALTQVVRSGSQRATAQRDWTVKVDVSGLQPGRTYFYRFSALGEASPVGRTRTLPAAGVQRLRIAVVSCSNLPAGYFNVYRRIAERADLDLVLHLGDYLYEYASGQYGSVRPAEPANEIITLTDYRTRHAQYKRDADAQELHRQHPMAPIWDDHEVANDSWLRGAQNHDPATEGTWLARRANAIQAYYEWMPVREPADRLRPQRNIKLGDLAEIVLLEERLSARSEQLPAPLPVPLIGQGFMAKGRFLDPERTLLGATQESWLAQTLSASTARWKVLGQGVMVAQLKVVGRSNTDGSSLFLNPDQWDGYPPARDRLLDTLAAAGNVVVLTGDIHSAFANDLTRDPNNPDANAGGYDPATGRGSVAVEFITTSVSSPSLVPDPDGALARIVYSQNPHIKSVDLNHRGYLMLDVTPARVVGEQWIVDTVAVPSTGHTFVTAFEVQHGSNHLVPSAQTAPVPNPPPLAP